MTKNVLLRKVFTALFNILSIFVCVCVSYFFPFFYFIIRLVLVRLMVAIRILHRIWQKATYIVVMLGLISWNIILFLESFSFFFTLPWLSCCWPTFYFVTSIYLRDCWKISNEYELCFELGTFSAKSNIDPREIQRNKKYFRFVSIVLYEYPYKMLRFFSR